MSKTDSETVLILGGYSAIANAYARLCASEGLPLVLTGRNRQRLEAAAADLEARGAPSVSIYACDLADTASIATVWETIVNAHGSPFEVMLAYGVLGDMDTLKSNPEALKQHLITNFVSAAIWLERAAAAMEAAGLGRLVVIGSVAGDRGRQSNYPYGAAKGALGRYAQGMAHRFSLHGGNVSVHLVKLGFVDTPMTEGMPKDGPLWASPERVAQAIRRGVLAGRQVFYVPWFWRAIMLIIQSLPASILHRTRL